MHFDPATVEGNVMTWVTLTCYSFQIFLTFFFGKCFQRLAEWLLEFSVSYLYVFVLVCKIHCCLQGSSRVTDSMLVMYIMWKEHISLLTDCHQSLPQNFRGRCSQYYTLGNFLFEEKAVIFLMELCQTVVYLTVLCSSPLTVRKQGCVSCSRAGVVGCHRDKKHCWPWTVLTVMHLTRVL